MTRFPLSWRARASPLEPTAVFAEAGPAEGSVARRLIAHLLAVPRAHLSGVASARVVVILGEREQLPWVDGVRYLGRDPLAPQLLLPTTEEPVLEVEQRILPAPLDGLERRVLRMGAPSPIAVLPSGMLVSVRDARALDADALGAWLALDARLATGAT